MNAINFDKAVKTLRHLLLEEKEEDYEQKLVFYARQFNMSIVRLSEIVSPE